MKPAEATAAPAPVTAAICGLCCDVCSIFIAGHEDPQRLALLAGRLGWDVDEAYCDGCRSDRLTPYCRDCDLRACAQQRGHAFCNECADYPCSQLEAFQRERPHRAELYQNLDRIAEVGAEAWLVETKERYSCPACGTLNSTTTSSAASVATNPVAPSSTRTKTSSSRLCAGCSADAPATPGPARPPRPADPLCRPDRSSTRCARSGRASGWTRCPEVSALPGTRADSVGSHI